MQIIDLAQFSLSGSTQFTSTGTVLNDPLTEYTGTSTPNWTLESGTVSYGVNGVTTTASGSTNSVVYNAGSKWSPISGAGAVTGQVTFTIPSTLPGGNNLKAQLFMDANNYYDVYHTSGNLTIDKVLNGVRTNLTNAPYASASLAGATVNLTTSIDPNNVVSAVLKDTNGNTLASASFTVTSPLAGPFAFAVGGGTGVVSKNVTVTGPVPSPASAIAEAKYVLWSADGTLVGAINTPSAGGYFLQDGGSSWVNGSTSSNVKIFTLSASVPPSTKFAFEAAILDSVSGNTAYCALWDITSGSILSSSQISTTSTTATVVRSLQFTLTPGHVYGVTGWQTGSTGGTQLADASLIVFP